MFKKSVKQRVQDTKQLVLAQEMLLVVSTGDDRYAYQYCGKIYMKRGIINVKKVLLKCTV